MMWLFLPWNKFLKSNSVVTGCWGKGGGGGRRAALDSFISKEVWVHRDCAKCVYIMNVQCVKSPRTAAGENRERRADSINPSFSSSLMFISEIFIKAMLLALRASSLGFELKLNTWSIETSIITYQPPMYGEENLLPSGQLCSQTCKTPQVTKS